MREERITIRPFEELQVEHYEGLKQVNEHGVVQRIRCTSSMQIKCA